MIRRQTSSDAVPVPEQGKPQTKQELRSDPFYIKKPDPDSHDDREEEEEEEEVEKEKEEGDSKTPLTVIVEPASQFFTNPERIYPMCSNPRGKALIINNQKFSDPDVYPFRLGANVDTDNLQQLFTQLGFQVIKYANLKRSDTMKILIDFADTVGSKGEPCDMLIVCVLSHGKAQGKIVASDCLDIDIEQDILRRFNNEYCPQLQGKPKFFILQACRGDDRDYGTLKAVDCVDSVRTRDPQGSSRTRGRPLSEHIKDLTWEDMLIAYSTLPGYVSNRDHFRGTWFIESICKAFMAHAKDMDLRDLLDEAAWIIKEYESESGTKQSFGYEVRHFYKKLYFNPGHFVSNKEKWKHTNSMDFDTLLLEKSLEQIELDKLVAPLPRKRTMSDRVT